jgi:hypothetical protein
LDKRILAAVFGQYEMENFNSISSELEDLILLLDENFDILVWRQRQLNKISIEGTLMSTVYHCSRKNNEEKDF